MTIHTSQGVVPWPEEFAALYREKGNWEDRPLGEYLLDVADRLPNKVALVSGDTRLTYADLADRMDAAAERLLALGLEPDDRIQRLINLTARLVDKMLLPEQKTRRGSPTDEQ